jgi:predicted nucleic-acid-binding protein
MKQNYFLDTNVFLRFLLNDHKTLSVKAEKYFTLAQNNQAVLITNHLVIAEVYWVLKSFYKQSATAINQSLTPLLSNKNIVFGNKQIIFSTLILCQEKNIDFVDAYSFLDAKRQKLKLTTFDRKLQRLGGQWI